ncbi:MAG: hypothetical protein IT452_19685 [Planctomycetia bacterium]|nr:hypothetical protein [Planctomycetia bacterium]
MRLEAQIFDISDSFESGKVNCAAASDYVPSGSTAAVDIDLLGANSFHWRARTSNTLGEASEWVEFGDNGGETDFVHVGPDVTGVIEHAGIDPSVAEVLPCLATAGEVPCFREEFAADSLSDERWWRSDASVADGRLDVASGSPTSVTIVPPAATSLTARGKAIAAGELTGAHDNIELLGVVMTGEGLGFTLNPDTWDLLAVVGHPDGMDFVALPSIDARVWHDYAIRRYWNHARFYVDGRAVADLPTRKPLSERFQVRVNGSTAGRTVSCEYLAVTATPAVSVAPLLNDPFDGTAVDPARWTLTTNSDGAGAVVTDGQLRVNGGTTDGGGAALRSVVLAPPDCATELRVDASVRTTGTSAALLVGFLTAQEGIHFDVDRESQVVRAVVVRHGVGLETVDLPTVDPTSAHDLAIVLSAGSARFYMDAEHVATMATMSPLTGPFQVQFDQSSEGEDQTLTAEFVRVTAKTAGPDGHVLLVDDHFNGTAIEAPWAFGSNSGGAGASVASGALALCGGGTDGGGGWIETTGRVTGTDESPVRLAVRARLASGEANTFLGFVSFVTGQTVGFTWMAGLQKVVLGGTNPTVSDGELVPIDSFDPAGWHEYVIVLYGSRADFLIDGTIVHNGWTCADFNASDLQVRLDQSSTGSANTTDFDGLLLSKQKALSLRPRIVFMSDRTGHNEFWKMNPDGSDAVQVSRTTGLHPRSPRIRPGGSHILGTSGSRGSGHVVLMKPDGSEYHEILTNVDGKDVDAVAWSPDGSRLCVARDGLWIYTLAESGDGVDGWHLTSASAEGPDWAPDGSAMLFGYYSIKTVSMTPPYAPGIDVIVGGHVQYGRWSPDSSKIAFEYDVPGGAIYVMNADGSGLHVAYSGGEYPEKACWMSESRLLFDMQVGPTRCIYAVNVDGSELQRITGGEGHCYYAEFGMLEDEGAWWSSPPTSLIAWQMPGRAGSSTSGVSSGGGGGGGGGAGDGGGDPGPGDEGDGGTGGGGGGGGTTATLLPPRNLRQFTPGDGIVGVGETVHSVCVGVMATVWSPTESDLLRLEIEVRRGDGEFEGDYAEDFAGSPSEEASVAVPSGSVAVCTIGAAPAMSLRWRARTVNDAGEHSEWVEYGGNPATAADFAVASDAPVDGHPPAAPSGLAQFEMGSPFELPIGGTATTRWLMIRAQTTDIDLRDHVRLEVELRRANGMYPGDVAEDWTGVVAEVGSYVDSGSIALVRVPLPDETSWKWRIRATDEAGHESEWVEFGANEDEADFGVDFGDIGPVGGGSEDPPAAEFAAPSALSQSSAATGSAIPIGESSTNPVLLQAVVTSDDPAEPLRLEVQVVAFDPPTPPPSGSGYDGPSAGGGPAPGGDGGSGDGGSDYDGVPDASDSEDPRFADAASLFSDEVTSGHVATVTFTDGVPGTKYIWRARTIGSDGRATPWVVMDGSPWPSFAFQIVASGPPPSPGYDGPGAGDGPAPGGGGTDGGEDDGGGGGSPGDAGDGDGGSEPPPPPPPPNAKPVADAGADIFVEASSAAGAIVSLNGSASVDPDGDALTWTWTGDFGTAGGATPTVTLGIGAHVVTLTVTDGRGGTATDSLLVGIVDSTAPVIASLAATPDTLSPPNHKMVAVTLTAEVTDAADASPEAVILSVESNEPTNGLGDGDTPVDWEITGAMTLNLRAERSGQGSGRVYTITVQVTDASGNSSRKSVTVSVPKGSGKDDDAGKGKGGKDK